MRSEPAVCDVKDCPRIREQEAQAAAMRGALEEARECLANMGLEITGRELPSPTMNTHPWIGVRMNKALALDAGKDLLDKVARLETTVRRLIEIDPIVCGEKRCRKLDRMNDILTHNAGLVTLDRLEELGLHAPQIDELRKALNAFQLPPHLVNDLKQRSTKDTLKGVGEK